MIPHSEALLEKALEELRELEMNLGETLGQENEWVIAARQVLGENDNKGSKSSSVGDDEPSTKVDDIEEGEMF